MPDIGDVDMKDFYKHRVETGPCNFLPCPFCSLLVFFFFFFSLFVLFGLVVGRDGGCRLLCWPSQDSSSHAPDRRFWSGLPVHHDAIAVGASHTAQMAVFGTKLIDEDRVLTATSDGIMSVRSLASQEELVRVSMPGGTLGLGYSPAERRAICGNFDSSVYIWDLNAGTRDDLDAMRVKKLKVVFIGFLLCLMNSMPGRGGEGGGWNNERDRTAKFDSIVAVPVGIARPCIMRLATCNDLCVVVFIYLFLGWRVW